MSLPLLARAAQDDGTFVHVSATAPHALLDFEPRVVDRVSPASNARCGAGALDRVPDRRPGAGEQYRFHIDMDACIGCKCCVVACNEQNGNPATINWRRVAEVEGGAYPATRRAYFSMGCNHCADPTCMKGCPVDAYSKDEATGIVRHNADTCIGCQYCTWTCSYGVPQFNPERGVVGKCDMCHGRLALGQAPACVSACPEGAIGIEIVNVSEWRAAAARAAGRRGMPAGDGSLSTTRVTMPAKLPDATRPVDADVVTPADAHAPLVVMTVLSQLALGAVLVVAAALLAGTSGLALAAAGAAAAIGLALACATLHLGRPIHAYRAMKMWRRSWLSREVILLGAFAKAAGGLATVLWFDLPGAVLLALATLGLGLAGVTASAFIYRVPSRPTWHTPRTFVHFFASAAVLGPLYGAAMGIGPVALWRVLTVLASAGLLVFLADTFRELSRSTAPEPRGAALLLRTTLRVPAIVRVALLVAGGVVLPLTAPTPLMLGLALALAALGELAGRYLFFVTAVPRHLTAAYFEGSEAA